MISYQVDDRSGGPKIWIYKDRNTGEGNGRATVTYEDEETANRALSEYNGTQKSILRCAGMIVVVFRSAH